MSETTDTPGATPAPLVPPEDMRAALRAQGLAGHAKDGRGAVVCFQGKRTSYYTPRELVGRALGPNMEPQALKQLLADIDQYDPAAGEYVLVLVFAQRIGYGIVSGAAPTTEGP